MGARRKIGDVWYVPVEDGSLENDQFVMGEMGRAGVHEIEMRTGETGKDVARRIAFDLTRTGNAWLLLGGLIVPESIGSIGWTPAVAAETERALLPVKGDDKEMAWALLMTNLAAFLEAGLIYAWTSVTSRAGDADQAGEKKVQGSPTSLMESGPSSFAN